MTLLEKLKELKGHGYWCNVSSVSQIKECFRCPLYNHKIKKCIAAEQMKKIRDTNPKDYRGIIARKYVIDKMIKLEKIQIVKEILR